MRTSSYLMWYPCLPCVPVNLAIKVAGDRLRLDNTRGDRTSLSSDQICTLLSFCLNAMYVSYKGVFYKQTQDTAMGSPVSVTVVDLVMEDVEQWALSTFPNPLWFWKGYVDDTCVALQSDQVEAFHLHLNSIEPTIQFTMELETAGCLPFLDTQITRHQDGSLSTIKC